MTNSTLEEWGTERLLCGRSIGNIKSTSDMLSRQLPCNLIGNFCCFRLILCGQMLPVSLSRKCHNLSHTHAYLEKFGAIMNDIRWKQRFENFDRAFILLREVQERGIGSLSLLEKEGTIQRFEFTFELAWKTLKDYLEEQGIILQEATPRAVIKAAFSAGILDDAQIWIDILQYRNLLSHTYDFKILDKALKNIEEHYFSAFDRLHEFFLIRSIEP